MAIARLPDVRMELCLARQLSHDAVEGPAESLAHYLPGEALELIKNFLGIETEGFLNFTPVAVWFGSALIFQKRHGAGTGHLQLSLLLPDSSAHTRAPRLPALVALSDSAAEMESAVGGGKSQPQPTAGGAAQPAVGGRAGQDLELQFALSAPDTGPHGPRDRRSVRQECSS